MRVLLDTCAVSELRRPKPEKAVVEAIEALPSDSLFLSVITIGEIVKGIQLLNDSKRKRSLQGWLLELERYYGDRILAIDAETTRIWGELTAKAQQAGTTIGVSDGLIAATARRHGLHVITRNEADFEASGALLLNPWAKS